MRVRLQTTDATLRFRIAMAVPVLDASRFVGNSPADRFKFAEELLDSLQKHGFVKLRNHGISDEMVEEMFRFVRKPSRTEICSCSDPEI